ncbi:MAG: TolC family protein, partial [Nitrospiria bacterium]
GREVTEGPLRIANTDIAITRSAFEAQVSTLILNVSQAYWDLVFQIKNLAVQRQTLESSRQLLAAIRTKVELGLLSPLEILVAQASVAAREEAVFIARKGVFDTEDQLRLLLNLPEQALFDPPAIQPTDPPTDQMQAFKAEGLLEAALQKRPELAQNRLLFQNQSLSAKIAKDKLSPSLDLVGRLGVNGLGRDFSDETEQLGQGSFHQWEAGLVLTFPLGNQAARADVQREKINIRQTLLKREMIIQQITLETKEGLRRVQTDFQRIKATRRARLLAEEKLAAGHERFELGLISSQDLLEFQDDLAKAKGSELKAVIDYNKSLVNLEDVSGALLARHQIETFSPRNDS